ncbi:IS4/Tn5 family transposase DNA-binding protein [Sphaerothrix gracilis]|uniref:IS4/Tn5 family transposase DNA-binding protein n=1 Tax=Sphaerothrix gracilis TaxID=3151835 RepID=UPI0031FCE302
MSWAKEELQGTELGDRRRSQRLVKIVEDLISQPSKSVPQASRDNAAMQGMYEFWSNRRIEPSSILSGHSRRTVERCQEHSTVLAIQDTTELDLSRQRHTRGLGPISKAEAQGLKVHITLCSSDGGVPLGILPGLTH